MAEHWIAAREAARIVGSTEALRGRLAAGLVRFRAQRLIVNGDVCEEVGPANEFWSNEGRERLQQDWSAGDFVSSFDGLTESRACGVQLEASDVLAMLPFEERAAAARSLSVAGNSAWISARETRRFAYDVASLPPLTAGRAVMEQCRLGFVSARAVEARWARGTDPDDWTIERREWDIPTWFWDNFTTEGASSQDWERGTFAGQGSRPQGFGWMTLNGVHFLRSSLDVLLPNVPVEASANEEGAPKPNLPEAELQRWWAKLAAARDSLTQTQLHVLAKADHPDHSVSRERIRALAEGRRPGPRGN
jgi:hypothetical protein